MATQDQTRCPVIQTNSDAFYRDPESILPDGPRPDVAKSEYGYEFLSYPLVRKSFRDKRMKPRDLAYFEKLGASDIILEFIREGNLNFMAPDKHDRIRAIVVQAFTTSRIEAFRPQMRAIATDLIERFATRGRADLVGEFCHEYPISVIAQFVGMPASAVPQVSEATVHLRMLGQKPFEPGIPLLEDALRYLYDFIEKLVAERANEPPSDDFMGAMIALKESGENLSHTELIWAITFLLLGGHDTTRFTLAGCLYGVLEAGLWEALHRDNALIPEAISEGMRIYPGTPRQMRVVHEPLEAGGQQLEPGDVVSLNLSSAGRDPAMFDDAATFRCPRDKPGYDIGFGFGRHVCIGQALARTEMAEAIAVLTDRLTDVAVDGEPQLKPTGVVAGFESIPVRFALRD